MVTFSCGVMWRGGNYASLPGAYFAPLPILQLDFGGGQQVRFNLHQGGWMVTAGILTNSQVFSSLRYFNGTAWATLLGTTGLAASGITDPWLGQDVHTAGEASARSAWPWHRFMIVGRTSSSVGAADGFLEFRINDGQFFRFNGEVTPSDATAKRLKLFLMGDIDTAWIRTEDSVPVTFDLEGLPTSGTIETSATFDSGVLDTDWTDFQAWYLSTGGMDDTGVASIFPKHSSEPPPFADVFEDLHFTAWVQSPPTITGDPIPDPGDSIDNSDNCPCFPPGTVGDGDPPPGAGGDPWQQPIIGIPIGCMGGGLVPTQPDLVFSEQWWGM